MIQQTEEGKFVGVCEKCSWQSEPKESKDSAVKSLNAHGKYCPGEAEGTPTPTDQPEYQRDQIVIGEILERFGISGRVGDRVLASIQRRPQYLSNPWEFETLLDAQRIKGSRTQRLIVSEVFEELNPSALKGYGSMQPQPETFSRGNPAYVPRDDVQRRMERLEEKLEKEKELRHAAEMKRLEEKIDNQPSFFEQLAYYNKAAAEMGFQRGGRTTIDLLSEGISKIDGRVAEGLEVAKTHLAGVGQFNPEVTRTPAERAVAAERIKGDLRKAEVNLKAEREAEDEFLKHFVLEDKARYARSQSKHGRK